MTTLSTDATLFPADQRVRQVALELYNEVAQAPIISPHGHVDPSILVRDEAFSDPVELFISRDHYVTRLLFAAGVSMESLGVGGTPVADPRDAWRSFASRWHVFAGTASAFWLQYTFRTLFGIMEEPSAENADELYERIQTVLMEPSFRPRALFEQFRIEVFATTDDPLDDLGAHTALQADSSFRGRVIPTFRPDAYLNPEAAGFSARIERLASETGHAVTFEGYLEALRERRAYFIQHGAISADHAAYAPYTVDLDPVEANALFKDAIAERLDAAGSREFQGHMLFQMAKMSVDDGLVMTIHPGTRRNHHRPSFERFGPDTGSDIPVRTEYTENLRPMLEAFGTEPGLHVVLFTVDETSFSREIAPLAGFYPSLYIGAPWWFLDAPDAMLRFRAAVTETAGFYRTAGFVDDTRAFLSIPARHDVSRRVDATFLARLVTEGRISLPLARRIARDLVDAIPRAAFKL